MNEWRLKWPPSSVVSFQKTACQTSERIDDLCQNSMRIILRGNPERRAERRSIEQPGGGFRIDGSDSTFIDQRLDGLGRRTKASILAWPLRGSPSTAGPSSIIMRWISGSSDISI